jgi:hypothetical protein
MVKQIFHNYNNWECYKNGMWRKVCVFEEKELLLQAIDFTGDYKLYGSWMLKVIKEWPLSCEHHLSDTSINRKAYVGHAAVALGINCPEYITRMAWWHLTVEQQDLANNEADLAIKEWERLHVKKMNLIPQLEMF